MAAMSRHSYAKQLLADVLGGRAAVLRATADALPVQELRDMADRHKLRLTIAGSLAEDPPEDPVDMAAAQIPLGLGAFIVYGYRDEYGLEHAALVLGRPGGHLPVTIHRECLIGDVFGAMHCGCGERLGAALDAIITEGQGILLYLRGRGAQSLRHLTTSPSDQDHLEDGEQRLTLRIIAELSRALRAGH